MKTEDTFIDDNLFDTDQKEIKKVSEDVLQDMNIDQNKALFVDLSVEWLEKVKNSTRPGRGTICRFTLGIFQKKEKYHQTRTRHYL